MDDRSLTVLEFTRLLEILRRFSISPLGQRLCLSLRPTKDISFIRRRLSEVMELKHVLEIDGDIPLKGLKDIDPLLKRLEIEGAVLSPEEIMDIYNQIELCKGLRKFFLKSEHSGKYLKERVAKFSSLKDLEKEILHVLGKKGEILDRASPKLSDIRCRLERAREKIKTILNNILTREELRDVFQEQIITLRNGRYVLLIKSEHKHRLKGIIHDQSKSHMSLFFEPLEAIPLNNEIHILVAEENEEQYRILADLSQKIRTEIQNLWKDFDILGELDLLYAISRLSIVLKGVEPLLNEEGRVDLVDALNPLLCFQQPDGVVPVHLKIGNGIKTLIISGANAGGKTVALKTLGLLTLMAQSGIPIPAKDGSEVSIFEDIFAVIGDEQNIGENLSTFSAHLLHVNQILKKAGKKSLVLLDELGVGTNAQEGSALAMAFLDKFREREVSLVITTHFDALKAYGYLYPDVENAAVEFDEETLEPRYRLSYGRSGLSNAFLVAEKLGISKEVIQRASIYRGGGGQEITQTLETLERLKSEVERERDELKKEMEKVSEERRRLKEILENIKGKRQEILLQAEEKAKKIVQKVEEELKGWLRQQKEKKSRLQIHRKEIFEIKEKFFPNKRIQDKYLFEGGLKVGDRVRIKSLRREGILLKIEDQLKRAEVATEQARLIVSIGDITRVDENGEKRDGEILDSGFSSVDKVDKVKEIPTQINVIGLRVEDAIPVVDKFIDQAIYHGLDKVQIIHGIGSGRLRSAIGRYLKGHRGVKYFAPEETQKGGGGVTVVDLR